MRKKFLTMFCAAALILCQAASAANFIKLGECPVVRVDENANVTSIDIFDNEIYGNTEEISRQQWYDTATVHMFEENPFIPYSKNIMEGESTAFNDGIQFRCVNSFYKPYDSDQIWYEYVDNKGNAILSTLPAGWQRTWDHYHHYNFGYFTEAVYEIPLPEYAEFFDDEYNFAYSTITNAFTGEVYKLDGICISSIDNNGFIYFCTPQMRGGEFIEKFYRATLKKSAVVTAYYNGEKIAFDQVPVIENGRTLVPLRAIFEKIGADVEWDSANSTVVAKKADTKITLPIDSTAATVNDEIVALDVPAKIVDGRTLVPLRFVADCFDVDVKWEAEMQKIVMNAQ